MSLLHLEGLTNCWEVRAGPLSDFFADRRLEGLCCSRSFSHMAGKQEVGPLSDFFADRRLEGLLHQEGLTHGWKARGRSHE